MNRTQCDCGFNPRESHIQMSGFESRFYHQAAATAKPYLNSPARHRRCRPLRPHKRCHFHRYELRQLPLRATSSSKRKTARSSGDAHGKRPPRSDRSDLARQSNHATSSTLPSYVVSSFQHETSPGAEQDGVYIPLTHIQHYVPEWSREGNLVWRTSFVLQRHGGSTRKEAAGPAPEHYQTESQ
jgi:hypothetical protein